MSADVEAHAVGVALLEVHPLAQDVAVADSELVQASDTDTV